jgi:DNA modification methylase
MAATIAVDVEKPMDGLLAKPVAPSWPADQVERRLVAQLIPYARNSRLHSEAQIAQIAASINEFGFAVPILVDEGGTIIAGHARAMAAARLGLGEVPVVVARGWSEAQKRAYVIADNKLTENGGWDEALLKIEVADLVAMGFDVPLLGFSESELAGLTGSNPGLTDPDDVPEPPAVPVTQRGEVWQLGRHRLVCGDATCADDVVKVLAGVAPHLMVTDPPYGIDYDPAWRSKALKDGAKRAEGVVINDSQSDWTPAWQLFPGDVAYCWHDGRYASSTQRALETAGFEIRYQIIWSKSHFAISRGHYHIQHESCWYAVRQSKAGAWQGDRSQSTIWQIGHQRNETGHSTQKPVECMKRPIENNSSPGQAVYDPFVGSGTTIIAAEMTGRACHALEIEPAYCDIAIERWQNFTGEKAKRV